MTNLRTHRLFTLSTTRGRTAGSSGMFSLAAMLCMLSLFCVAAVTTAPAQSVAFTSLYSFCWLERACPGGANPSSELLQTADGSFYGTTNLGGQAPHCYPWGCGAIFKMTPAGAMSTFYNFCGDPGCVEGSGPTSGLIQATDGNFYGTTGLGGANGFGTIFKITPEGTLTVLNSFGGSYGYSIYDSGYAELVQGSDGNFYGTTANGGTANCGSATCGTIFKITPQGAMTTLYEFCTGSTCWDGYWPIGGLVQGSDGNFYGTTAGDNGGTATVFKITPGGSLTTLYNSYDGFGSTAALIQATDGNFYGTTSQGGASNAGTIFKITPAGQLTVLYNFCSQPSCTDGATPHAGLVQGTDGNFYGTTSGGGQSQNCFGAGCGTVFQITAAGTLTTLHSFDLTDGGDPLATLVQAANGNFYGTADEGGADGAGTVFRIGVVHSCPTCRP